MYASARIPARIVRKLPGSMTKPARVLAWTAAALFAPLLLVVLLIAIFGWNWARAPIERMALERTGRELSIRGDLELRLAWPLPRVRAGSVSFANPPWAKEAQMVAADAVEIAVNLPQLLRRRIVIPEVRLERPVVYLEQAADGRRNWLLDLDQKDEGARVRIDRLTLDRGTLGYDDAAQKTSIRSELSTSGTGVTFTAQGQYLGLPLKGGGSGGPVLGLRDETLPYALKTEFTVGRTGVQAEGTIASLLRFSAVDMRLALRGDSLAQLYPLFGIAFPETRAYTTSGHLMRSANIWRYEKFSGRIGASDIRGNLMVETGGKRPALKADLASQVLDIEDLGPMIGARPGSVAQAKQDPARGHVLPDIPFDTARWGSVDAEVTLTAATIRRANDLPIEALATRLSLRDSVLKLDPLDFGVAGGRLDAAVTLDGRRNPIRASAQVKARKILLSKLLPAAGEGAASLGQVNGEFNLTGSGNSVGKMLASSNGKVGLVVAGGEISKLMLEKAGLRLWEILELKLSGDRLVKLRCGVADFDVKSGVMQVGALVVDTEITTILGKGSIDLGSEKLDLTLVPRTKKTSITSLRSPIYVRGTLADPDVQVDMGSVAARGLGAIALSMVNPLLLLVPLIDAGPGKDSDCGQLVRDARALPRS